MRPQVLDFFTIAADADGICESQTPGGAGDLTLDGNLVAGGFVTFDHPRRVLITTVADETNVDFTIYGTDRRGNQISDVVSGVDNATVSSVHYFATVARIAVDGATAGAVTAGTSDQAASGPLLLDTWANPFNVTCYGTSPGDFNGGAARIQYTADDPHGGDFETAAVWFDLDSVASNGALPLVKLNGDGMFVGPIVARAVRLIYNGESDRVAAGLRLTVLQAGGGGA